MTTPAADTACSHRTKTSHAEQLILAAICVVILAPIWVVRYIPATDLPSHLGIGNVLWQLLTEPGAPASYSLNLQPIPYYLAYVFLVPAVGLLGPFLGVKVVLSLVAVATLGATRRLVRAVGGPAWLSAAAVFAFYGSIFF